MTVFSPAKLIRFSIVVLLLLGCTGWLPGQRAMTFEDVMKFNAISQSTISPNGQWIAYRVAPDRGDGEVRVRQSDGSLAYTVERGTNPQFSKDSNWLAVTVQVPFKGEEKPKNSSKEKPKPEMMLLRLENGETERLVEVNRLLFSDDSKWLAYLKPETEKKTKEKKEPRKTSKKEEDDSSNKKSGSPLHLRRLADGREFVLKDAEEFSFDRESKIFLYSRRTSSGDENGLFYRALVKPSAEKQLHTGSQQVYGNLAWGKLTNRLAFLTAEARESESQEKVDGEEKSDAPQKATLFLWDAQSEQPESTPAPEKPDFIPFDNNLQWSDDGQRLFFGLRFETPDRQPEPASQENRNDNGDPDEPEMDSHLNIDQILKNRKVDVWHWQDEYINPQQKKRWPNVRRKRYLAVLDITTQKLVALSDLELPEVRIAHTGEAAIGFDDRAYRRSTTWDQNFRDLYRVDLTSGQRTKIAATLADRFSKSPGGRYLAYFRDGHWFLYDSESNSHRNLTHDLSVNFQNEDHDYPSLTPSYGLAGWVGEQAVLINDKFDIWQFSTGDDSPLNLTGGEGRKGHRTFRVVRLDPDQRSFSDGETLLLTSYHDLKKNHGFYRAVTGSPGVEKLLEEQKRFRFLAKAKDADRLLFSREDYDEFADLWVSDLDFNQPRKLTDANPQMEEIAWGTSELVQWRSLDGTPLQGVLIKPGNYQPGKRYPVLVYFYRFFSQRLHEFNQPRVNHRPAFPLYASNGYAIFLPDIRFEVGRPGLAAVKSLVPGVQKLVEMGIADPDALGLHGHSWSGYQTAFIITQTNIFAAAVAGAPVSNMTSAYGGIRWGSGRARQFQYEKTQSRLGATLWEERDRYIDNSPLFFADQIQTPLLIQFGDEDGAVPWYQGIELYLAMRRLGKDSVFLQYRGEPHHLQKYPNKLDYAIKMKEYFDHYLKGAPAPLWITEGVPYQGK